MLLLVGMLVYTAGELIVSQASLVMLTQIPPREEQGAYMAQSQILVGLCTAFSPLLVAYLLTDENPTALWAVLAVVSIAAACLCWRIPHFTAPGAAGLARSN